MSLTSPSRLLLHHSTPIPQFLAPSWTTKSLRALSTTTHPTSQQNPQSPPPKASTSTGKGTGKERVIGTLTSSQKAYLTRALRINQSGELAATNIYASQTPILTARHPHLRPLLQHMHAQESAHLSTFNTLLHEHRIRPSALTQVWRVAANILGWGTGMLGREAAMACTEAVETEIGGHYNDQVRVLVGWEAEFASRGQEMPEGLGALLDRIRVIRDEELEHLDTAVENDARDAVAWPVLTAVIRGGCRAAIWAAGRV